MVMSDEPVDTGLEAEGTAPDIGHGEPEAAPSPDYLDTDQYSGHHVRLRVDGEEVEVPLSEALAGYSRQSDYTRKTQELADLQRQAQFGLTIQQALEANPAETLRILQAQYEAEQQPEPEPNWTDDPQEAWRQDIESRFQRFEQQQADHELRQAIGVLRARYGDEFNPQEVVQAAFQQNRMDLEGVYKEMAFDRYWQGQQAAREAQAAEEAARTAAKSQAANTVHAGNGATNAVAPVSDQPMSIEEAFEAAKREHGWT